VTKSSPFKNNYGRKSRMGFDIRKKGKNVKTKEFVKKIKDRHKKAKVALVKSQEEMKRQADRNRKEAECYKLKSLALDKRINLILGLIQENSIENSVQNSLPLYTKALWLVLTTPSLP